MCGSRETNKEKRLKRKDKKEDHMKRSDYLGIPVRLVKNKSIPIEYLPGATMASIDFTTDDVFTVEHDFRDSEESGIRVGFPNGSWAALTSEQLEDMFGCDALADLNSIRYDD
jgi:hypothetical protein